MMDDFGSPSRVDFHLLNWQAWMRRDPHGLKVPGVASGGMGISHSSDLDGMIDGVDTRNAATVDALIRDLTPAQRAAVERCYLDMPYKFPRDNYQDMLDSAKRSLGLGLVKRMVW